MTQDQAAPRDVANTAEAHVITLPQRAYALLFAISTEEGNTSADRRVIEEGLQYLEARFLYEFQQAASDTSVALTEAREALAKLLQEFCAAVPSDKIPREVLVAQAEAINSALTPAVSAFLAAMFDDVVAWEQAAANRARDMDSDALSEIEQIARKIKFIAVNASVEAARAGDLGKAFAVIASEIKDLSDQSKNAVDRVRSALV